MNYNILLVLVKDVGWTCVEKTNQMFVDQF